MFYNDVYCFIVTLGERKKNTTFCVVAELPGKAQNKNEEINVERKAAEVKNTRGEEKAEDRSGLQKQVREFQSSQLFPS